MSLNAWSSTLRLPSYIPKANRVVPTMIERMERPTVTRKKLAAFVTCLLPTLTIRAMTNMMMRLHTWFGHESRRRWRLPVALFSYACFFRCTSVSTAPMTCMLAPSVVPR